MPSAKRFLYRVAGWKAEIAQRIRFEAARMDVGVAPVYPDFLGIGTARAGTTWLYERLETHPEIHLSRIKELHFFDRASLSASDGIYDLGDESHWRWYYAMFRDAGARVRGEITPSYLVLPEQTLEVVARRMPGVKLILSIRNPVERAWSAMRRNLWRERGLKPSELDASVLLRDDIMTHEVLRRGDYRDCIPRWERYFPAEQFHFMFFEDIETRPRTTLESTCRFLGVDPGLLPAAGGESDVVNAGPNTERIPDPVRRRLIEIYSEQADYLATRFQRDVSAWFASR